MNYLTTNLKKTTSNLLLFTCVAMMALSLNSCTKSGEDPLNNGSEIPGLGNAEGNLTGTPFRLPDGIELIGNITGAGYQDNYWLTFAPSERKLVHKDRTVENPVTPVQTRADNNEETHYRGSGEGYVDLLISLRNTRSTPVEVTIPAATIIISQSGDSQHGVLIKKVTFTIPANESYRLSLSLYCGNLSKSAAYSSDIYIWGVVSNAKALLDLCDRVKNKKINIEEFSQTSSADRYTYESQVYELQDIVWDITDSIGKLANDAISYINSLPNSN
jgi:hypothetical protein